MGMTKRSLLADFFDYPKGRQRFLVYTFQEHFRGRTAHGDWRFAQNGFLLSWTIANQVAGVIEDPVLSLSQAERVLGEARWKLNPLTGKFAMREIRGGVIRQTQIQAWPKSIQPKEWLFVEGVTRPGEIGATRKYPGVFFLCERHYYEPGARKPSIWEVFCYGKVFNGRYFFRPLELTKRGREFILPPSEEQDIPTITWELMKPESQLPNVFAESSRVKRPWVPPQGWSALPRWIMQMVPAKLRYWNFRDEKTRLELRDELFDLWKENGTIAAIEKGRPLTIDKEHLPPDAKTIIRVPVQKAGLTLVPGPKARRVRGRGDPEKAIIAFIGDGPGAKEIEEGEAFVGLSGQFLEATLRDLGVDIDDVYFDNLFKFPGEKQTLANLLQRGRERIAQLKQMPNLRAAVALSEIAARGLLQLERDILMSEERGKEHEIDGLRLIVTYHPAAILRTGRKKSRFYEAWRSDLARAVQLAFQESAQKQENGVETGKFVLQRRWWRVVEVVRGGPVGEFWHLRMDFGKRTNEELRFDGNPLTAKKMIARYYPQDAKRNFELAGTYSPAEIGPPGPGKRGTVTIEIIDKGRIEKRPIEGGFELAISGRKLYGRYRVIDQGGGIFSFESVVEKAFLNVEICHAEVIAKGAGRKWERLVYGIVYEPYSEDLDGDWMTPEAIRKMAHDWMLKHQAYKIMHKTPDDRIKPVESFIAPVDFRLGNRLVRAGSWVLVSKIFDDKIWQMVLDRRLRGYSFGGRASIKPGTAPPGHEQK